jgi:formimidoylglutamate deiminase
MRPTTWWAPAAWVDGRWQADVRLSVGADGCWSAIAPGVPCPPEAAALAGPVLPGLVDAHSHAFQRAFAGLAERQLPGPDGRPDDFWSWRDQMYRVALTMSPEDVHRWAARLYRELLAGGYTQVCEFHYLHHDRDGTPYAQPLTLCDALAQAAADTGIGLTLLPTLYERAGFAEPRLRDEQRRFAGTPDRLRALRDGIRARRQPHVTAGLALHSLRAVSPASLADLADEAVRDGAPLHLHVAEQTAEVEACLAATGARPLQWLLDHAPVGPTWHLVHATHVTPDEIDGVARAGAGVVLCPSTEANLGDGFTDVPGWLASGTALSVGSDSHVTRAWSEELRWLDYGQRLRLRRRNVCGDPALHEGSVAARLFERVRDGGGRAAGFERWGLMPGARADLLLLDLQDSSLAELPWGRWLEALVASSPSSALKAVMVAGRWVHGTP